MSKPNEKTDNAPVIPAASTTAATNPAAPAAESKPETLLTVQAPKQIQVVNNGGRKVSVGNMTIDPYSSTPLDKLFGRVPTNEQVAELKASLKPFPAIIFEG